MPQRESHVPSRFGFACHAIRLREWLETRAPTPNNSSNSWFFRARAALRSRMAAAGAGTDTGCVHRADDKGLIDD